jgi:hypothetical protein
MTASFPPTDVEAGGDRWHCIRQALSRVYEEPEDSFNLANFRREDLKACPPELRPLKYKEPSAEFPPAIPMVETYHHIPQAQVCGPHPL